MRHESQDIAHLWDIMAAADGIVLSVAGLELEHYLATENLRMAVERRVEIIGEAARRVSDAFRMRFDKLIRRSPGAISSPSGTYWHTSTMRSMTT